MAGGCSTGRIGHRIENLNIRSHHTRPAAGVKTDRGHPPAPDAAWAEADEGCPGMTGHHPPPFGKYTCDPGGLTIKMRHHLYGLRALLSGI
jgi:hypothetical protein